MTRPAISSRDQWMVTGLIGVYLVSLCLPAIYSGGRGGGFFGGGGIETMWGIQCLLFVPFVMIMVPWWANPPFFLGLLFLIYGTRRVAFYCALSALLLGLCSVFYFDWDGSAGFTFGPGYYAWISCLIGLLVATCSPIHGWGSSLPPPPFRAVKNFVLIRSPSSRDRWIAAGLFGVYLVAFVQPVIYYTQARDGIQHWTGAIELLPPAWLANPVFLLGLVSLTIGYRRITICCAIVALVLAFYIGSQFHGNDSVTYTFGPGYYGLVSGIIGLLITTLLPQSVRSHEHTNHPVASVPNPSVKTRGTGGDGGSS